MMVVGGAPFNLPDLRARGNVRTRKAAGSGGRAPQLALHSRPEILAERGMETEAQVLEVIRDLRNCRSVPETASTLVPHPRSCTRISFLPRRNIGGKALSIL
jgi:hypothetical protein